MFGYARTRDYAYGGAFLVGGPTILGIMEVSAPSYVGPPGIASAMRLALGGGAIAGFAWIFTSSSCRSQEDELWTPLTVVRSTILRLEGECKGSRDGHARDGRQSQAGRAAVRTFPIVTVPSGCCR